MAENFYDKIAKLCIDCFDTLPKTGKPTANEWTVLSCIVKQDGLSLEVVSLGTGSKCVGRSSLSPHGDVLNDSHAEVVCRRSFLRYLYAQMGAEDCEIFTFDCVTSKYRLKSSITFHFFTSCVPCGDAAIFPKSHSESGDVLTGKRPADCDVNDHTKRLKVDLELPPPGDDVFRTGAKCLPTESRQDLRATGLGYHTVGAVRTKPGRGNPTLSVSCSDKFSKWSCLGVQGALLSLLMDQPIYLSTFTIAGQTPFCQDALSRALYGRFDAVTLKAPYRLNKMSFGQATMCFEHSKTDSKQPCPSSIAWCKVNVRPSEVVVEGRKQGVTKKKQGTKAGRLQISKVELFRAFVGVVGQLKLGLFRDLDKVSYSKAKMSARAYQEAWKGLKCDWFKVWTVKDDALLRFTVD